ncbi:hypothetical protein Tco_0553381 [Tanacetum coccineum]
MPLGAVEGEGSVQPTGPQPTSITASPSHVEPIPIVASSSQPKKTQKHRKTKRKATEISQSSGPTTPVADEIVHEERGDKMERAATTASSLEAEQDSDNIIWTQSMATLNEPIPQGTSLGSGPKHQDTVLGDIPAQTRFERLSKQSHDSPLPRVNTLRSDEGSMTLQELTVLCTTLSKKVEGLEADLKQTKQIYGATYTKLIKKVKKLERAAKSSQARSRTRIVASDDKDEDSSKQGRKIAEIDQDPDISLVQHDVETQGRYRHDMEFDPDFDAAKKVSTAGAISIASIVVSTASPTRVYTANDITLAETLVYIRKSVAKDKELAQRLQVEEREKYTEAEQARMLAELINQRKRYFAEQRAEEKRNKPPTQAQQRTYMSNYIKHVGSHTLQQLRGYSFDEIKALFETTMRRVNTFVPIESKVDRGKRDAKEELNQESSNR